MKSILTVIGTRPEAIKLAPLLRVLGERGRFNSLVCLTGQHTRLSESFLQPVGLSSDWEWADVGGDLHEGASKLIKKMGDLLAHVKPDLVVVQGDTTTAFASALAAFYAKVPVAHVEAGLRTGCFDSPWPEEGHRTLIGRLAHYSFAPTDEARSALLAEGVEPGQVWVVGNTSVDALRLVEPKRSSLSADCKHLLVVTIHRRESQGASLMQICEALRQLAERVAGIRIVVMLHPNPEIRGPLVEMLSDEEAIRLLEPLSHPEFVGLLRDATLVLTDSGGIQEEVAYLGKPALVVRDRTERPEVLSAGNARLVSPEQIAATCLELLGDSQALASMSHTHAPYGDGYAADRIVDILEETLT